MLMLRSSERFFLGTFKGKKTSGIHYTSEGHEHSDFRVQIIEKVTPNTEFHRLEREEYWIKKFVTMTPFGLNVMN